MPFHADELRVDLACAPGADGHWRGWYGIHADADALRRLGLHPDQPTARVTAPSPPRWWHEAAERHARGHPAR
ncbi:hypothetical protein [Streptomyces sp. NPDC059452]|uniref:hypothetical protein n=1 Tax=Streptomyces sp. NPDC059452 TaxID=3346835 RepID=UPI00369FE7B6